MQMNDMVLISVDDHITEPPTVFDNQLSGKDYETAPKMKIAKDGAVMSESQRRTVENDFRNQARELKRSSDEFREDFNLRRNEELGKFQKQVLDVINSVAKEDGFDLVVNDSATLYASPQVAVTEKVLKRLTSSR